MGAVGKRRSECRYKVTRSRVTAVMFGWSPNTITGCMVCVLANESAVQSPAHRKTINKTTDKCDLRNKINH